MGDYSSIIQQFLGSEEGQKAHAALTNKGIDSDAATEYLGHAAREGAAHTHEAAENEGVLGDHPGRNFFAAFAAGLVRGDGVFGALGDGAEGLLIGRITEALCDKAGVDDNVASTVAATAAPFVITFLRGHLGF